MSKEQKNQDKTSAGKSTDSLSFESAQVELEAIVQRMERGEQELEQSLADFERGVALMNRCHYLLKEAEQKVDILVKDNDGLFTTQPFDNPES